MKKIGIIWLSLITSILIYWWWFSFAQSNVQWAGLGQTGFILTWCIERVMKITAYYSTEPTQGVWFHGDYETEKKINGGGWHGASGKKSL